MDGQIRVVDVEKYYGTKRNVTRAVNRVSFNVEKGEFLGIMGASGSGKTTLLNMMSTIDRVTAGHIYYGETDITMLDEDALSDFRREHLGFIFQDFNLLDTLTIEENIILGHESSQKRFARYFTGWKGARLRECAPPTDGENGKTRCEKARSVERTYVKTGNRCPGG